VSQSPYLAFPIAVDAGGSLATDGPDDHLRDLVLQVLFTEPGERVNLPEFGCGVKRLVFGANSDVLRATAQFLITHNLQRWLGDLIDVSQVSVTSPAGQEEALEIDVEYTVRQTRAQQQVRVTL
jgi:uncharacterized protein